MFGGPQVQSERGDEEKISNHCPCRELSLGYPARSLVTIMTELARIVIHVVKLNL